MGLGGLGQGGGQGMPKAGKAQWRPNTSAVENFDWMQPRFQSPQMPQATPLSYTPLG
jgi:hypothetical protein